MEEGPNLTSAYCNPVDDVVNCRLEVSVEVEAFATVEKGDTAMMGVRSNDRRRSLSLTCGLAGWGACHDEAAEISNVARRALADVMMVGTFISLYDLSMEMMMVHYCVKVCR